MGSACCCLMKHDQETATNRAPKKEEVATTGENAVTSYYVNWKDNNVLDRVLDQEAEVCYAIAMTRQLGALLRLEGLLGPHESLSIQYVINETRRILLKEGWLVGLKWDGSIPKLEKLTSFYTSNGIVLNKLVPLTYSLTSENPEFDKSVKKFNATRIIHHYLTDYKEDVLTFEKKLLTLLMDSPVSVVVPSYDSFWEISGRDIYCPTASDLSSIKMEDYHVMLLIGAGCDEFGNKFWYVQDSTGCKRRGEKGFIRIGMGTRFICRFIEMSVR